MFAVKHSHPLECPEVCSVIICRISDPGLKTGVFFITTKWKHIGHWGKCTDEIQDAFSWLGEDADRVPISMLEEDITLIYIIMKTD